MASTNKDSAGRVAVQCPQCGRTLNFRPGAGPSKIGCRGCLHHFNYDPKTGALEPLGRVEALTPSRKPAIAAVLAVLLGVVICLLIYYKPFQAPPPAEREASANHGSALEEVQRQLKSLSE